MKAVDVLVVGLGPAGAAAAGAAARGGLTVFAIDKKQVVGEPVQCAEFVPRPMLRYCQFPGVLQQSIETMRTTLPSGAADVSAFPGLMIDRSAFDRALAEVAQHAGAVLGLHTQLVTLNPGAGEAGVMHAGKMTTVRYRLLVAADGPRSSVARLLGLPVLPSVQTRQYTVPLQKPYSATDIWLSDEFAGGYGWMFPKGRVAHVGVGTDRRYQANLKQPLERLHQQLVAEGRVGQAVLMRTGGDIPVGGLRSSLIEDAVLFVGDAAGLTHPVTGAGISAAVISGLRAGEAAVEALAQGRSDALVSFEEDVRDQFEDTLLRAVASRRRLDRSWHTAEAAVDGVMRRGWIAFPEYFSEHRPFSGPTSVFSGATP